MVRQGELNGNGTHHGGRVASLVGPDGTPARQYLAEREFGGSQAFGPSAAVGSDLGLDPEFFRVTPRDAGGTALDDPYSQHPWFYAATLALARAVSAVPFIIYEGTRPRMRSQVDARSLVRARRRDIGDDKREANDTAWTALFDKPCPACSRAQLWQATAIWEVLHGENFWVFLGGNGEPVRPGQMPAEMWPQTPQAFQEVDADGTPGIDQKTRMPAGWRVGVGGGQDAIYLPHQVAHFKLWNPNNPYRGQAPAGAAASSVQADHAASTFNLAFFRNGCDPGGIFSVDKTLTKDQRKDFLDWVQEQQAGLSNRAREMLLERGATFQWNPRSQKDAEFMQMRMNARDEMLAVIGTMKGVLSITDALNYATFLGQKRVFYEQTVIPRLLDWEDVLWDQLFSRVDGGRYWGEFDLSGIPALQDDLLQLSGVARTFFDMGWSRDEINSRLDLGFDADPLTDVRGGPADMGLGFGASPLFSEEAEPAAGGTLPPEAVAVVADLATKVALDQMAPDTAMAIIEAAYPGVNAGAIIVPSADLPAPAAPAAGAAALSAIQGLATLDPRATAQRVHAQAQALRDPTQAHHELMRSGLAGEPLVRAWTEGVRKPLEATIAEVVRKYFGRLRDDQMAKVQQAMASLGTDLTAKDIQHLLFNRARWDTELQRALGQPLKRVQSLAAGRLARQVKVPSIPVTSPKMLELHARKLGMLVEVNAQTQAMIRSDMIKLIAEGGSVADIQRGLDGRFDAIGGTARSLRVARTEVGMMQGATIHQGMRDTGVKKKRWLDSRDSHVRPDHAAEAAGAAIPTRRRYPITKLMHPLEFGGAVEQVVNCRCDEIPVLEEG